MQLVNGVAAIFGAPLPFSILNRIGGDATRKKKIVAPAKRRLSVSSIGSEAMQPIIAAEQGVSGSWLSVSSIGSEAMQLQSAIARGLEVQLSVSSIGSEAMQPRTMGFDVVVFQAFSILNRIGGDATPLPAWP